MIRMYDCIMKKKKGEKLTSQEIREMVSGAKPFIMHRKETYTLKKFLKWFVSLAVEEILNRGIK